MPELEQWTAPASNKTERIKEKIIRLMTLKEKAEAMGAGYESLVTRYENQIAKLNAVLS